MIAKNKLVVSALQGKVVTIKISCKDNNESLLSTSASSSVDTYTMPLSFRKNKYPLSMEKVALE
jgi:hypothetical protein